MWTIVLTLLIIVLLVMGIVLFGSFSFRTEVCYKESVVLGKIQLRWITPLLFSLDYDLSKGLIAGRFLGRRIKPADQEERKGKRGDSEIHYGEDRESDSGVVPPDDTESAGFQEPERKEVNDLTDSQNSETREEPVFKQRKRMPKALNGRNVLFLLKNGRWRRKIVNWLKRVFYSLTKLIRFNCLKADVKAGLKDPALTGKMFGCFLAVKSAMVIQKRNYDLSLKPVFMKNHLEFDCAIAFKTTVWRFCVPVLTAIVFFPYIHTYRLLKLKRAQEASTE